MTLLRTRVARGIIRIAAVAQSAATLPLTADAARAYMRSGYSRAGGWGPRSSEIVGMGLQPHERSWLDAAEPLPNRRVLVLGSGVGREAIALAEMGREVTAVDFVPSILAELEEQAAGRGVNVETRCGDLVDVAHYGSGWGLIWSTWASYSAIQGRRHRASFLREVYDGLAPGGRFLCRFIYKPERSPWPGRLKRLVALGLFANPEFEPGDRVYSNLEFQHVFGSVDELRTELERSPLEIVFFDPERSDCAILARR